MLEAFREVLTCDAKTKALYGGSSSGKTHAVQQYGIIKGLSEPDDETLVLMETESDVKVGMFKPMCDMMDAYGLSYDVHESAPISIDLPSGHRLWFSPIFKSKGKDSSEAFKKFNNVRRVIINEATALTWEDHLQLKNRMGRTKAAEIIYTWNPTDEFHWLTKMFVTPFLEGTLPPGVAVHHSTHWDNPYLTPEKHQEYEDLINVDTNYYRVYCLGLPGKLEGLIYIEGDRGNWIKQPLEQWPEKIRSALPDGLGLDWGYSGDHAAVVAMWENPLQRFVHQLLYRQNMTVSDIARRLNEIFSQNKWPKDKVRIFCDPSRPDNMEELRRAGFNIPDKTINDICYGIDIVKGKKEIISEESIDLVREKRIYAWAMKNGQPVNLPVDKWNHALDAERYVIASTHAVPRSDPNRFLKYSVR